MQYVDFHHYCGLNETLELPWWHHGVPECVLDTIQLITLAVFLFVFGGGEFYLYYRHGTPLAENSYRKCGPMYYVQLSSLWLVILLCGAGMGLQVYFDPNHVIYGYMIVTALGTAMLFLFSLLLVRAERMLELPSTPTQGHGIVLLIFWTLAFIGENVRLLNVQNRDWWSRSKTLKDDLEMAHFVTQYLAYLLVFILGLKAPGLRRSRDYSLFNDPDDRRQSNGSTFRNFRKKVRLLASFLIPAKSKWLQCRVFICFLLLLSGRVINVFVPIYNKLIVDSLSQVNEMSFDYTLVFIYVLLRFCQGAGPGSMGFLNNLRSFLWVRVQQYTTREVEVKLFRHLHTLSLRWHLDRKTGEVLRIMDRGTDSINNLITYVVFSITPTILDILVAVIFFISTFNVWFGSIVFITMVLYIFMTILVTEWRTKYQRRMNLADNEQKAQNVDSLLNYETVKYFSAENFEINSYYNKILNYQKEEFKNSLTLNLLNTIQNIIISTGLLIGSLLCIQLVTQKKLTLGDYVLFGSYIVQLYVPLNWLGTFYRTIQRNFVDMENMLELLEKNAEVQDIHNAPPLNMKRGQIEFENVTFGYNTDRMVLRNISFIVPPGKSVAFVGPSGSGKSTILRLLFRFFDVEVGEIRVDDQNIKMVQQHSLRQAIGVVPQDTVLFNNTIIYNIRYGRPDATDAEVIEAAKNAEIHDSIMSFPDGYETRVGERGLRLSGGEKQRIGIARTMLKSPTIVLLDEATSALDTQTERNIQSALNQVCVNRTTIIIAHRLSTIIHVDEILVLKDGEIIERGKHTDLISYDGVYANMWRQQLDSSD